MSEASASPKAPTFGGYGDILDILVQKRKDKWAAARFFKKLMKGQDCSARNIVSDKLPSYGAASSG
jgi:putative transposase